MPSICQMVNLLFIMLVTMCFLNKFVAFCQKTGKNSKHMLDEGDFTSRSRCKSFYWAHISCNYFDPVCSSDGKVYKNRCYLEEELCSNPSPLIKRTNMHCLKGKLDTRPSNEIFNTCCHLCP